MFWLEAKRFGRASLNLTHMSYDEVFEVLGQRKGNQIVCGLRSGSSPAAQQIVNKMLCPLMCRFFRTNFPQIAFTTVLALKVSKTKAMLVTKYNVLKTSVGPCIVTIMGLIAPPLCIYGRGHLDAQAPSAFVVTDTRIPFGVPAPFGGSEAFWEPPCRGKGNWQTRLELRAPKPTTLFDMALPSS